MPSDLGDDEPRPVSASLAVKTARDKEAMYAMRVKVDNACQAMSDTFGERDHRVQQMFRRLHEILEPGTHAAVSLAAAYSTWCTLYPDEIVATPTKPCRCDNGWTEVEPEEFASITVRPCSRCNGEIYGKYFENVRQTEERIYDTAGQQAAERRPPFDPEDDW